MISQFCVRRGTGNFAVVADAGMLSAANLAALDTAGCKFIVGSRLTKAPIDLESHFGWHGDYFGHGHVIDTLTRKTGRNDDNDPDLLAEPVWDPRHTPHRGGPCGHSPAAAPSATPAVAAVRAAGQALYRLLAE
jgi:hypothetical protein